MPGVVGIAYGPDKAAAVHAACAAGYVDTLVTTAPLAHELLSATRTAPRAVAAG